MNHIVPILIVLGSLFYSVHMSAQRDYTKARENMVIRQLEQRGIKDKAVLDAMRKVERHLFVPEGEKRRAYWDQALPIGYGQTISQPYVVAYTLDVLDLKPTDKVFEVGTGSGYLVAILAEIVDSVVSIEIVEELAVRADALLQELGYDNVLVMAGDGFHGYEAGAPYDAIIVSAADVSVPPMLVEQLAEGGRLIMPIGPHHGVQDLTLYTKKNGKMHPKVLDMVRFVPFTRKKN